MGAFGASSPRPRRCCEVPAWCGPRRPEHSRYLRPVRIEVNGEAKQVEDGITVRALLDVLRLGNTLVAVERNEEIVPRAEHATCALMDGDRIEVVEFVGGG